MYLTSKISSKNENGVPPLSAMLNWICTKLCKLNTCKHFQYYENFLSDHWMRAAIPLRMIAWELIQNNNIIFIICLFLRKLNNFRWKSMINDRFDLKMLTLGKPTKFQDGRWKITFKKSWHFGVCCGYLLASIKIKHVMFSCQYCVLNFQKIIKPGRADKNLISCHISR